MAPEVAHLATSRPWCYPEPAAHPFEAYMSQEIPDSPQTIGRYRLLDELATGGMAVVHLAIEHGSHGLERPVVIKQLQSHHDDESSQRMLLQEARLAARVNHPNVVEIHELGTDGERPFIAMEYVPGAQLRELSRAAEEQGEPCPVGVAVGMLMQACAGAHAAHELLGPDGQLENLVHRDLSPHNLMVNGSGHVKVLDFGVAKAEFNPDKTETGVLKGKYAYMSPEQLEADEIDRRSDVFTLGTVLWELLVGRPLFGKQSAIRTIHSVLNGQIPPIHEAREGVPEALSAVVGRALSRTKADRYQTADDLRRALQTTAMECGLDTTPDAIAEYVNDRVGPLVAERQDWVNSRVSWGLKQEVDPEATTLTEPAPPGAVINSIHTQSTIRDAAQLQASRRGPMPWILALSVLVLVGVAWWVSRDSDPVLLGDPIRIGLAPTMDASMLEEGWDPILGYLESELGRPVEVVVGKTYAETREQLLADEVDFAVLPPLLYIQARQAEPELRLLMLTEHDDALQYDGVLIVRTDSEIETLEDLDGKQICYVNKDSTTGYHLPRIFLKKEGLDPDQLFDSPRFSETHQRAIQDLSAGLCEVAATTSDFHHEASLLGGSRAEIGLLEQTGRPPNDAICASPGMDDETVQRFTEALLGLKPEQDLGQARVGKIEKLSGFSRTDDSLYDSLRESLGMGTP